MSSTATNDVKDVENKDQKNGDQNGEEDKTQTQTPPVKEMRAIVLTGFGGMSWMQTNDGLSDQTSDLMWCHTYFRLEICESDETPGTDTRWGRSAH